jgi:hypothetical protein
MVPMFFNIMESLRKLRKFGKLVGTHITVNGDVVL